MADVIRVAFQFKLGDNVRLLGKTYCVVRRYYEQGQWTQVHAYDVESLIGGIKRDRVEESELEVVS